MKRIRATTLPLLVLVASLTGCGEPRADVHPVLGKLVYQGTAPAGAQVVLHPVNATSTDALVPSARVKPDGTFSIGVYEDGDGAPEGEYIATVEWFRVVERDGVGG